MDEETGTFYFFKLDRSMPVCASTTFLALPNRDGPPGGFPSCARPTRGVRDRALREHRKSPGLFLLLFLFPSIGGSGQGCPLLRASNEHFLKVRVLRARRAPGRSPPSHSSEAARCASTKGRPSATLLSAWEGGGRRLRSSPILLRHSPSSSASDPFLFDGMP
jgi:hypothetical protein